MNRYHLLGRIPTRWQHVAVCYSLRLFIRKHNDTLLVDNPEKPHERSTKNQLLTNIIILISPKSCIEIRDQGTHVDPTGWVLTGEPWLILWAMSAPFCLTQNFSTLLLFGAYWKTNRLSFSFRTSRFDMVKFRIELERVCFFDEFTTVIYFQTIYIYFKKIINIIALYLACTATIMLLQRLH